MPEVLCVGVHMLCKEVINWKFGVDLGFRVNLQKHVETKLSLAHA
jgi:hypothetical protein